jgi:hypothetical protein
MDGPSGPISDTKSDVIHDDEIQIHTKNHDFVIYLLCMPRQVTGITACYFPDHVLTFLLPSASSPRRLAR